MRIDHHLERMAEHGEADRRNATIIAGAYRGSARSNSTCPASAATARARRSAVLGLCRGSVEIAGSDTGSEGLAEEQATQWTTRGQPPWRRDLPALRTNWFFPLEEVVRG